MAHYNDISTVIYLNVCVWMKHNHIVLPQTDEVEAIWLADNGFFLHEASQNEWEFSISIIIP